MLDVSVRKAGAADHPILERLWLMFWHDMSEFRDQLPDPDGTFHSERLQAALEDTRWTSYLLEHGERPIGLALVHDLGNQNRILNSFFVVRGARRAGIGLRAVQDVITRYPGHWEIAFQDENTAAVRFWRQSPPRSLVTPGLRTEGLCLASPVFRLIPGSRSTRLHRRAAAI